MKKFIKKYVLNRIFAFTFFLCIVIFSALVFAIFYLNVSQNKTQLQSYTKSTGFELYESITNYADALETIAAYLEETNGEITDSFYIYAEHICDGNEEIISISLAPNCEVEAVYPKNYSKLDIGVDFYSDLADNIDAQNSLKTKTAYLTEPYYSTLDEQYIAVCMPIFIDNELWGFVSASLKYPECFKDNLVIFDEIENAGYLYTVSKDDFVLLQSATPARLGRFSLSQSYVQNILGTDWTITISRQNPWYQEGSLYIGIFLDLLLSICITLVYVFYRLSLVKKTEIKIHEQEEKIAEQGKQVVHSNDLIQILASEFACLYLVDLDTDEFETYAISPYMKEKFGNAFEQLHTYAPAIKIYVENFVKEESQSMMFNITNKDNVIRELWDKKSFTTNFLNKQDRYCEMKFVKTEELNERPHLVALGFADKHDELIKEQLVKEQLQSAKDEAEAANNAKTSFLFNMSHDIRTPMNAIIGFANMALKHMDDQECVEDSLKKVQTSSEHLLSLINDILEMSRIESGKIDIDEKPVNFNEAIQKLYDINNSNAINKSIDFTMTKDIKHDYVLADELRINRVLTNIIGNAIKYTKPGGKVNFKVIETSSEIPECLGFDFIVSDTGIGISEEFLGHIFESFTREQTSTISGVQGTGLGMTITKQLVDYMGGTIKIESKVNVGTTVTVHFDFKESEPVVEKEIVKFDNTKLNGKRVLLVEDNELNREIAHDILEEEGLIIDEATDGSEAVKMVAKANDAHYYDFVLMDIQMPYMDGYQATREIRSMMLKDIDKLPIIAMTANAFAEDKKKALDAGMDAHIAKPIDIPILIETLNYFID